MVTEMQIWGERILIMDRKEWEGFCHKKKRKYTILPQNSIQDS